MPEIDAKSKRSAKSSGSWFRLRFGIGALMLLIAIIAVCLRVWGYYGEAQVMVSYEVCLVDQAEFEKLACKWHDIKDSPYRWAAVKWDALPPEESRHQRTTGQGREIPWSSNGAVPIDIDSDDRRIWVEGTFAERVEFDGRYSARTAGGRIELRIEEPIHFRYLNMEALDAQRAEWDDLAGDLVYEGYAPEDDYYLVFETPFDMEQTQLVIVSVVDLRAVIEEINSTSEPSDDIIEGVWHVRRRIAN